MATASGNGGGTILVARTGTRGVTPGGLGRDDGTDGTVRGHLRSWADLPGSSGV